MIGVASFSPIGVISPRVSPHIYTEALQGIAELLSLPLRR